MKSALVGTVYSADVYPTKSSYILSAGHAARRYEDERIQGISQIFL